MPRLQSWFDIPKRSGFSLANIPFGIISYAGAETPRPAVAVGEHALDLQRFTQESGFRYLSVVQPHSAVFSEPTLNAFAALGRPMHSAVRKYIQTVFVDGTPHPDVLRDNAHARQICLVALSEVQCHLPMLIRDYTDFYVGLNHAYNCGVLLRGPDNALQPNYKHLPVGYHGRASSVVVSGTDIRRPRGQILESPPTAAAAEQKPVFSATRRMDMELELGAFVCKANAMGEPVSVADATQHLFGLVLMNDWSARDIQAWEMVPLGPFNGKNFGTSISPWVVLLDALEPFKAAGIPNDAPVLPYLQGDGPSNVYDIRLQVELAPKDASSSPPTLVTETSARHMLFSFPQMLAHHTVGGCPFNVGDLIGSGTISGTEDGEFGSLLEKSRGGKQSFKLQDGSERVFMHDGDTVTFRGVCGDEDDGLVGFGQCSGTLLPALPT